MNNTKERNKKIYITPTIEVTEYECDDILTGSANGNLNSREVNSSDFNNVGSKVWSSSN